MQKRRLNRLNLSIVIIVPILFGGVMVAIWALGLGISALFHSHYGIPLTWLIGFCGVIALWVAYHFLIWLSGTVCVGIGMLIEFIYEKEEK